jgi:hypothetical protein
MQYHPIETYIAKNSIANSSSNPSDVLHVFKGVEHRSTTTCRFDLVQPARYHCRKLVLSQSFYSLYGARLQVCKRII